MLPIHIKIKKDPDWITVSSNDDVLYSGPTLTVQALEEILLQLNPLYIVTIQNNT